MKTVFEKLGLNLASLFGERTRYGCETDTSERGRLHTLLPYRSYDPETGTFQNESGLGGKTHPHVGFVLETAPMVGSTEAMQREISALFQTILPEGSHLQFLLWADPRIGGLLDTWSETRNTHAPYDALSTMASERHKTIEEGVQTSQKGQVPKRQALFRDFRVMVSYCQEGDIENPVERQALISLKEQIKKALETLGCPIREWNAQDLIQAVDGILNVTSSIQPSDLTWHPYDSLEGQIPAPGVRVQVNTDHLCVTHTEEAQAYGIQTFSLRQMPDHWALYAMGELIGDMHRDLLRIPCPFMLHYGVHVVRQQATSTRIQSRQSWVESQARSKIGRRFPILIQQAKELDFVRYQTGKGERFVETAFSAVLFSPMETLVQNEQTLLSLFRSKRWRLVRDPFIQLPLFLSTLPMNWGRGVTSELRKLKRLKTTLSTESANLLPIQGEWKGTTSPGMLLTGRRGQVMTWSPFDNASGNYNVAVVGRSGSGKSVFMQDLMSSILGQGGRVYALDVGRSFEKLVKLLGGTFIEFTTKTPISLNPFSSIPEDDAGARDALSMLKPIVSLMAAPKEGTTDLENAALEKALLQAWQDKGKQASMTDVSASLFQNTDALSHTLAQKLFPYTKDGIYGRFFEGPMTVDLSAPFVVMEMEELKERKDLQAVIVQIMILEITNTLYLGNRTQPTALVLDEAWDMLRGNQSGVFIETAARRLRKYRGSLVVGTQSVNDFYATPGAQAAFDNSDWMCLLSQKAESIAYLKKTDRIMMDGAMESLLASLKTEQGQYAEIMIYGPHGYAVTRLILDPFSQILYSTKAEEYAQVKSLQHQGHTLESAIGMVAQSRYGMRERRVS